MARPGWRWHARGSPVRRTIKSRGWILAAVAGLATLAGCAGSDQEIQGPPTGTTPGQEERAAVGDGPMRYPSPVPRAPGTPSVPALAPENAERNRAIIDAQAKLPLVTGTVNGFRLVTADDPPRKFPCDDKEASVDSVTAEQMPFSIAYFPTGTAEDVIPFLRVCPDGSIYGALRA